MIFDIDSEYQLVFGDDYFFYNGTQTSRKQLISSYSKDTLVSITLQDDNQYWVYNLISKNLMFQSGPKGDPKLMISYRDDYDTKYQDISLKGISDESFKGLKQFLEGWVYD